jgi:hypothetical protein
LRDLFRRGFSAHAATVSHCSESRWALELHGVNAGIPIEADVRLRTTLGAQRRAHVQLHESIASLELGVSDKRSWQTHARTSARCFR